MREADRVFTPSPPPMPSGRSSHADTEARLSCLEAASRFKALVPQMGTERVGRALPGGLYPGGPELCTPEDRDTSR